MLPVDMETTALEEMLEIAANDIVTKLVYEYCAQGHSVVKLTGSANSQKASTSCITIVGCPCRISNTDIFAENYPVFWRGRKSRLRGPCEDSS